MGAVQTAASDAVAEHLRTAIHHGLYAPGDRLVERRIAGELGVSHIPVREALARLTEEGLVVRLPGRSARVRELDERSLDELAVLRLLLERMVAVSVCDRFDATVEHELEAIVEAMRKAAQRRDRAGLSECDELFHTALWRHAGNGLLLEIAAQLRGRVAAFLRAATEALSDDELLEHAESHARLTAILAARDRRAAGRAMEQHITAAATRIRRAHEAANAR